MSRFRIRGRSALPLFAGLAVAQLIATLFVRRSNLDLQQSVAAMQKAGWLPLPAGPAAESLDSLAAAFWGGLFYTLSVGAGLALAAWGLAYLWQRLSRGRIGLLWPVAGAWAALILAINYRGWALFPTLFAVCVPLATVLAVVRIDASDGRDAVSTRLWPLPLVTLLLLTGLWSSQLDARLFSNIRDHLLLSNAVGRSVNDFYYKYTLHAAQTFKSFGQKELRTCRLELMGDELSPEAWAVLLARHDVVVAPDDPQPDVMIRIAGNRIVLESPEGDRIETGRKEFLAGPDGLLKRFSETSDRYAPLRRLTFAGLLVGFPVLLFVIVDGIVGRMAGRFTGQTARTWWRSGVCLGIGILLLIPMAVRPPDVSRETIEEALSTEDWRVRVAALRAIGAQKLDIAAYPQYRRLLQSPRVVERYYLARTLALSRTPATFKDLLRLIEDRHPNVVCQAFSALGRRGDRSAVPAIRDRMTRSDHWYAQWYGYRALRSLGWRQSR